MRIHDLVFIGFAYGIFMTGCATMQKNETHEVVQNAQPTVSKTLNAEKSANINVPKGLKYKVAIGRFSNETRYGQSFFLDQNNDRIGKQAMDILSSKLFETDRFIMLERADLAKIQDELMIGGNEDIKNAADYLIIGSITEFGRKETSEVGLFSKVKKQEVFAKVHIRIVDVQTGQIIYSEEGDGKAYSEAGRIMGVGEKSAYDAQLNDKAIDAAISDLTNNIIENMLERPWHGYILRYEEGNFIISGGKSQNVKVGQKFDVMQNGKKIKNPQTGMMITLPGKKIAQIEVVMNLGDTPENEVSLAKLTDGSLTDYIQANDFGNVHIKVQE